MKDLQRVGGVAALVAAATNLVGAVVWMALLEPKGLGAEHPDPNRIVALLADNEAAMRAWYLIIFIVFGPCVIVLAAALYERMKAGSVVVAQAVAVVGLIYAALVILIGTLSMSDLSTLVTLYDENPARAATTWSTLDAVETGLGAGGGETILSGLWFLALGWAALRTRALPRPLSYLGLVTGLAGVLTVLASTALTAVYAIGLLAWFLWLGVALLRKTPVEAPDSGVLQAAGTTSG